MSVNDNLNKENIVFVVWNKFRSDVKTAEYLNKTYGTKLNRHHIHDFRTGKRDLSKRLYHIFISIAAESILNRVGAETTDRNIRKFTTLITTPANLSRYKFYSHERALKDYKKIWKKNEEH